MTDKFRDIKPFNDNEVSEVLLHLKDTPTMAALLQMAFPNFTSEQRFGKLFSCTKIKHFQSRITYPVIKQAIAKSVTEFSHEGFERLEKGVGYLFISNHRDIILDTSFLNIILHDTGLKMTASAIGDNLVRKSFLLAFAKLNRNFLIHRGLPPREMLEKSRLVSEYIYYNLLQKNRSVWIAQREGRTKDGNDHTQQGVLKMLAINCPTDMPLMEYIKSLNIVPMAISYELDPTDRLKMPSIMAKHHGEPYVKAEDEDFNNIVQGFIGQKGRVCVSIAPPLNEELDQIAQQYTHPSKQIQALVELLDEKIHTHYKLYPINYAAYDLLANNNHFGEFYTDKDVNTLQRRIVNRSTPDDEVAYRKYLEMYANPVKNKYNL